MVTKPECHRTQKFCCFYDKEWRIQLLNNRTSRWTDGQTDKVFATNIKCQIVKVFIMHVSWSIKLDDVKITDDVCFSISPDCGARHNCYMWTISVCSNYCTQSIYRCIPGASNHVLCVGLFWLILKYVFKYNHQSCAIFLGTSIT